MPRDIPIGNGKLLVCFDSEYHIRDLYFPHVGQENHMSGNPCRLGVWVNGSFSWVGQDWNLEMKYLPDTLVTDVSLHNKKLGILLSCRDAVDFHENVYVKQITVENLMPEEREIRLFLAADFNIYGNDIGDTAAYDPETKGVVHYKASRYFLINGSTETRTGLAGFAVGQKGMGGLEGTFRDAEDGALSGNAIAQGSVDSVICLSMVVAGVSNSKAYFWLAVGESWHQVRVLDTIVKEKGPELLIARTADYWRIWVRKQPLRLDLLPEPVSELYLRSLLILRTQMDWQGGIIAGNDSDIIRFNRDTYSYVWPRDGALVANAMDLAGYIMPAQRFYDFVAGTIGQEGYFCHKYNPDGTLASSWHPWWDNGQLQLPIQEDETALVIWALWHHFVKYRDIEFIKPLYKLVIKNAADFMCSFRDAETGLPAPSYDLWEERRGIFAFTVGAVFGGLTAASLFCKVFGETAKAEQYGRVAAEIRDAASTHLWCEDLGRFCRGISRNRAGSLELDHSRDASIWGLFAFGLYAADDPKIISTMSDLKQKLWVRTEVGGMARYENDGYQRASNDVPGNPWFICTLWLADFLLEKAQDEKDIAEAIDVVKWVAEHALPSGVLAEQVHPITGEPLSVSPLTWSHATFVATVQRFLTRLGKIRVCPECGSDLTESAKGKDWLAMLYEEACDEIRGMCRI
ncbi:MAG: glycoside hydrolase family 15 protein [Desulfomonile tiedjei]|uniref:Glycoside hydrolase family 15 protein n=1 Tax=Desulfomonile tiedjei TaxID=2358 RepID=A0A9D6YZE8_9BACT|nr:glycoside hydrolase family 15 protein [Desulfomonile tiedjei]